MLDLREIAPERARPIKRSEYDKLVELGFLEGERIELLEGVLVEMSPRGPLHDSTVDRLTELFVLALQGRARIRVQGAFAASDVSEPAPDLAVLPIGDYDAEHPQLAHLLVEVSASSLVKDRGPKARVYARAGVDEYWIVNLVDRVIEVRSAPTADGYTVRRVVQPGRGEAVTLRAFPNVTIAVDDILR